MNLAYKNLANKSFGIWEDPPPQLGKNPQKIRFFCLATYLKSTRHTLSFKSAFGLFGRSVNCEGIMGTCQFHKGKNLLKHRYFRPKTLILNIFSHETWYIFRTTFYLSYLCPMSLNSMSEALKRCVRLLRWEMRLSGNWRSTWLPEERAPIDEDRHKPPFPRCRRRKNKSHIWINDH